jgi:THO complex subunit 1
LHLQHFGKIGTGDIVQLSLEIEKEAKEKEKAQKEELNVTSGESGALVAAQVKGEEDVKMGGEDTKSCDDTSDDAKAASKSEGRKTVDIEGDVKMESDVK